MAHMGRAVDHQPLDLMEHRRVRRVVVAAEGAARHDDADGRLLRLHGADLHRRGVGAQQLAFRRVGAREIERVLLLARGMLGRDVEGGEIVEIVLDMRALGDGEAHLAEDGDDLVHRLADRMDAAGLVRLDRQGHVDALGLEPRRQGGVLEPRGGGGERHLDLVLEAVRGGALLAPQIRGERAQPLHPLGDAALAAERADADLLERVAACRPFDEAEERVTDLVEAFHHPSADCVNRGSAP